MSFPMISVIIPVYNTQEYIIECLNSLVQQKYQNFEVILINDGSTDASAQIIADYISQNHLPHFHLLHKENGGVSSARNLGLEHALGKWIAFVDSDDWADPDYFYQMIEGLEAHPADFCMTGFRKYFENSGEFRNSHNVHFSIDDHIQALPKIILNHLYGRLFLHSIISENKIRFNESIRFAEDSAFMFDYICHAMKVLFLPQNGYVYRIRSGSLTTSRVPPHKKQGLSAHAFSFWKAHEKAGVIHEVFASSYHIAHGIIDALLTDLICATLDNDTAGYYQLINSPITTYAVKHYAHKQAAFPEQFLVFLLKHRLHFAARGIIKIYYNAPVNQFLRKILKKAG